MHLLNIALLAFWLPHMVVALEQHYKPLIVTSITQPFSTSYRSHSLHSHLKVKKIYHSSSHPIGFNLMLLLAGDIALNPGPSFGFTNIRSLNQNSNSLNNFLSSYSYNIVGLTETWIQSNDTVA